MVTARSQANARGRPDPAAHRPRVCRLATGVATLFVLVGLLGFVPGVTVDHQLLRWAGPGSQALLLGAFQVSALLNLVHLGFGLGGLVLARRVPRTRLFLLGGGAFLLGLWLYGLLADHAGLPDVLPANAADNRLHLAFGVALLGLGGLALRRPR
jgi:hypothetical protein